MLFDPIRLKVQNVTEIGVASGQSLQMWNDYFPHAQLWGFDLATSKCNRACPKKFRNRPRVNLRWGNSCNPRHVDRANFANESMDLIIDDGDRART